MERTGFIGAGNMGEALARGMLSAGVSPTAISVADTAPGRLELFSSLGIEAASSNADLVARGGLIVLAVKPRVVGAVLEEIAPVASEATCFLSIAAGITTSRIEERLGPVPVVRAMPNTPCLVREGAVAISAGSHATGGHLAAVEALFVACATVLRVEESMMDAVTAVSGTGPAYAFYLAETMVAAAVEEGMDPELARRLAAQTILGAGKMLVERDESPEELRRMVTTPGGTTEAAIGLVDEAGSREVWIRAIRRAAARSHELAT